MAKLTFAAVVGVLALVGIGSAQAPQQQPNQTTELRQLVEEDLEQARQIQAARRPETAGRCAMPDGTNRLVNTTVTFNGWSYRCVAVFNQNFKSTGVAWSLVPDSTATPR